MDLYEMHWPEGLGGMLLLVAVDGRQERQDGGVACRVVGRLTPGSPFAPAEPHTLEERVTRMLASLGVPTNLRGYAYLRSALLLAAAQPHMLRGLGRQLYPAVAREHGASTASVERAIRHAIAVTWMRGGGERCRHMLGRACSCVGDHPSNGEFLTMLADALSAAVR